jgi:hypothetical protein
MKGNKPNIRKPTMSDNLTPLATFRLAACPAPLGVPFRVLCVLSGTITPRLGRKTERLNPQFHTRNVQKFSVLRPLQSRTFSLQRLDKAKHGCTSLDKAKNFFSSSSLGDKPPALSEGSKHKNETMSPNSLSKRFKTFHFKKRAV